MAASDRKRRYERREQAGGPGVTPLKLALLRALGGLRFATTGQLARWLGVSVVATRRHARALFDLGLVRAVPVARWALSGPGAPYDPALLYGSAENLYVLDREGSRLLARLDGTREPARPDAFGPASTPFLAHALAVRDVRIWIEEELRRRPGHRLEAWRHDADARIPLGSGAKPAILIPDAWFSYRMGERVLVGLVEADRGTEGPLRWREKAAAYRLLFSTPALRAATGYAQGRVLVTVPDGRRRDRLAAFLLEEAGPALAGRFWLACHGALAEAGLFDALWRHPGEEGLMPLVPPEILGRSPGE